jgi:hypothetical protein
MIKHYKNNIFLIEIETLVRLLLEISVPDSDNLVYEYFIYYILLLNY